MSDLLAKTHPPVKFASPPDVATLEVCPVSGLSAGPDCPNRKLELTLAGFPLPAACRHHGPGPPGPVLGRAEGFGLIRPLSGEIYALDPGLDPATQNIKAQARGDPEVEELVWRLNGREIKREAGRERAVCLVPLARGEARLEIQGLKQGAVVKSSAAVFTVR